MKAGRAAGKQDEHEAARIGDQDQRRRVSCRGEAGDGEPGQADRSGGQAQREKGR